MSLAVRTKVKPPSSVSVTYSLVSANVFVAKVGWTPAVSAWPNSYHVLYRDDVELATSIPAATSTYRDTGVAEGEEHVYTIGTVNVNEVESEQSDPAALHVPSYPVWQTGWSVSLDQGGSASIAGFATDPEGGSLTFSRQGGTAPATVTIASNGTVSVGASAAGGSYTLIIRATNAYLSSDTTVTMVVTVPISAPGTPSFAVAATSSSATLGSWAPTAGPAPTSYEMDRSLNGTSGWTNVFTGLALNAADTGLSANTQYFYRLRAFNGVVPSSYATANATTLPASGSAATWIVPADSSRATFTFNGTATTHPGCNGPSRAAQPGDILEFAAGAHGRVNFLNISSPTGSAAWTANPFVVRNSSQGDATFRSPTRMSGGFHSTLKNCFDMYFDGSGAASAPAHPKYPAQTLGLRWLPSPAASVANKETMTSYIKFQANSSTTKTSSRITFRNIEIDGGWHEDAAQSTLSNGIGIQFHDQTVQRSANPGLFQSDIRVLYSSIHNLEGEGIYGGPNYANGTIPVKDVEFGYIYCDMCGEDGLNGKSWFEGTNSMHDLYVTRCSRKATSGTAASISLESGQADFWNIYVESGGVTTPGTNNGAGLRQYNNNGPPKNNPPAAGYATYPLFNVKIFNVVAVNAIVTHGITAGGHSGTANANITNTQVKVYNCTSVGNAGNGINVPSEAASGSFVRNCISVDNGGTQISASSQSSNTTTGTPASLFTDPANKDFSLVSPIPASGIIGVDIAATDILGVARALGTADRGAYEK